MQINPFFRTQIIRILLTALALSACTSTGPVHEHLLVNDIALKLVNSQHRQRELDKCSSGQNKLFPGKTSLQIIVRKNVLLPIAENGVLNFRLTQQSSKNFKGKLKGRNQFENQLMGLNLDQQVPDDYKSRAHLRPKYGILSFDSSPLRSQPNLRIPDGYGAQVVVLKNGLKRRTTLAYGDSLNAKTQQHEAFTIESCGEALKPVVYQFKPHDKVLNVKAFIEIQVWGKISPDDIDYFLVDCHSKNSPSPMTAEITTLKAKGFSVFKCVPEKIRGNYARYSRGNEL